MDGRLNIEMDYKETGCKGVNWMELFQDRK
jgi:hypothetical protein